MSELIAEARVLVTPDTTAFRAQLLTQTAAAARGVTVPVQVTPVITGTTGAATLAAQEAQLAASTARSTAEITGATAAKNAAIKTNTAYARSLGGVSSGAASAGLSLVGLRGATLAASGPFLAGAAGAIALGNALQLATSFNSEIAVLGATTGATGVQLEQAAEAAREFGRDITLPGVTAGDAAKTITEFSKAGLSLNESIAATRGGLQLAQAAQLSYSDAVTLSANALNAFNLSGNQSVRVADTLANAANLAQGGIGDTALALRQAASAAEVVGVSFEDTTALLTLLARNGLTGSDAGTALRTSFLRLVNPSKQANAIIKDLGVNLRDASGNVRPEVFADFAEAQRDLSVATQQANAAIVFGQDAFRAFGILAQEGTEGLTEIQIALRKTGTAAEIAQARMVGLAGAQENLSNQLSSLGETIGQFATGPVTLLVTGLAAYVSQVNQAVVSTKDFASALNELGPGPSGTDILGGDIFGVGLGDVFGLTNPITGAASPLGQLKLFRDLFGDETEDTADEVKNGGVELRSALEDAGRDASRGAVSYGDQITRAIDDAFNLIESALQRGQAAQRNAALRATARGAGRAAGLEEELNQIVAGGGSTRQQIAKLQQQAANQEAIIDAAGVDAAGVQLQRRREAQARLAQINSQITSIEAGIAADQKSALDAANRIREDAARARDRAFLDAQEDARTQQERRVTLAEDTPQLTDDIRRQNQLRTLIVQQIAAIKASTVTEDVKRNAIRALRVARDATTDELKRLRRANKEQQEEARQEAADLLADNLSLRTQIAEARGNENAQLAALNAEIRNQQKRVKAADTLNERLTEELKLAQLINEKKELINKEREEGQGTTAFELLTQAADRFGAFAGNLIGPNQPFAGPTEFTADLSQFLRRSTSTTAVVAPKPSQFSGFQGSADRLVEALNRNTAALNGGEEGPPVRKGKRPPVSGAIMRNDRRWVNAEQARETVEGAGG